MIGSHAENMAPSPAFDYGSQRKRSKTTTIHPLVVEELNNSRPASHSSHFDEYNDKKKPERKAVDKRITELLSENLYKLTLEQIASNARPLMDGDINNLSLHPTFFVEGVKIGWPFATVMPPQRLMAVHLIKGLKKRRHVVLESPTGTGKSAAILCSALAWQRYHAKTCKEQVKIIYCSRTHSQVAQMVASLRKTPYRPRMAILGSRERLCIHPHAKGNTLECQIRVKNTERMRKHMFRSQKEYYDDNYPPQSLEQDSKPISSTAAAGSNTNDSSTATASAPTPSNVTIDDVDPADIPEVDTTQQYRNRPCCGHYRMLGTIRTAELMARQFTPKPCQCGGSSGDQTRLGSHDIEDLCDFGKDPYRVRRVAIYRQRSTFTKMREQQGFGMSINVGRQGRIVVSSVMPHHAVHQEGSIRAGTEILAVNNTNVKGMNTTQVANLISKTPASNPLLLDIRNDPNINLNPNKDEVIDLVGDGNDNNSDGDDNENSSHPHGSCPYYLSRALAKHAELVFCPYNYILDPLVRKSLDISLKDMVVVLDEAHNVEDTLREAGSGKFGEFELCDMVNHLVGLANSPASHFRSKRTPDGEEKSNIKLSAHLLLLVIEDIITFLHEQKTLFERNPNGAQKAIADWKRYKTPNDNEFDMSFDGPTGYGVQGKAVGCLTFFRKLEHACQSPHALRDAFKGIEEWAKGQDETTIESVSSSLDKLSDLVYKLSFALEHPEHYFIATTARVNGSFHFATTGRTGGSRWEKPPKAIPKPQSSAPERCGHKQCKEQKSGKHFIQGCIRHGSYCNGSRPPWEACLEIHLLTPAHFMKDLREQCRTVVLASGSLAPIPSLCAELGLKGGVETEKKAKVNITASPTDVVNPDSPQEKQEIHRLQIAPKPLEANHVIDMDKQLLALSIGHFPDGSPLTVTYNNYSKPDFIPKLGLAIADIVESIPTGGVLIFLPSYSFLRKCTKEWNPDEKLGTSDRWLDRVGEGNSVWDRLVKSKGKVIVEPAGSQRKFDEARQTYADAIKGTGSCILLAVFRGKMSEGISFNDEFARGVVCVGVPYPNSFDKAVKAKRNYNDEQRRLHQRNDILPGNEWYSQQAYRAIAQALGRCIRHAADYGTVVLLDSRHCDDGAPIDGVCRAHRQLPKWMRHHVRNLSKLRGRGASSGTRNIWGSWPGLKLEMSRFFAQAPFHCESVLAKQRETLRNAQFNANKVSHKFNTKTGSWTRR